MEVSWGFESGVGEEWRCGERHSTVGSGNTREEEEEEKEEDFELILFQNYLRLEENRFLKNQCDGGWG